MSIFNIFKKPLFAAEFRPEVTRLVEELVVIGKKEGYLSERPGSGFNGQCRHRRAREIGSRLNEIGGFDLMVEVHKKIQKKSGKVLADHLEYAWSGIGTWLP
jgi:hypothetical protein